MIGVAILRETKCARKDVANPKTRHDAAHSGADQLKHEHPAPAFQYTHGAGSLLQNCFYFFRHQWFFQLYISKMRMSTVKFRNKPGANRTAARIEVLDDQWNIDSLQNAIEVL